jgi:hypothetical protein
VPGARAAFHSALRHFHGLDDDTSELGAASAYWELAMLSPAEISMVRAEIERLEKACKDCTDSGLRKWIEGAIEKQKDKLASGNDPK